MSDQKNRWNWEVSGFEPRKSVEPDDHKPAPLVRRYSISASSVLPHSDLSKQKVLTTKLNKLKDKVQVYISLITKHFADIAIVIYTVIFLFDHGLYISSVNFKGFFFNY